MIELLSSGFYTSIQDNGRFNYTDFGAPLSGAMDQNLLSFANLLVGNSTDQAVIEMAFIGPKLKFTKAQTIAISAPKVKVFLNGKSVAINHQLFVKPNDILEIKSIQNWAYLSINGHLISEEKLESQSQYHSITTNKNLKKGDILKIKKSQYKFHKKHSNVNYDMSIYDCNTLQVYTLPEYQKLSRNEKEILSTKAFTISEKSNRMAYQFEETFENRLDAINSVPVMPGVVQLTPEGKLVVLMRDAQVTGGYPRIFQLSESSINLLSQKPLKSQINFEILKLK
ncbi:5-oxoprolinase subunit C family protein [Mesohalobacter halotolerans]|uniref:Allophanate hydrolase subunit 2 family protein n=1 Tax=Mesohalobacter halotolerans TaxID=1883405 RepID=A0A4U5TNU3_9FLAO|nr:allophanate hydrolase subunit 2 family protein [Mesohalobacter halotolerans]MBS3738420.1 allophanate hydrolase subunit 2 family protein [Psychroflexus sp.]TKS55586.1 allophanate hydrolase subunit 2 family protein [Mesohalobacter halotolerans]